MKYALLLTCWFIFLFFVYFNTKRGMPTSLSIAPENYAESIEIVRVGSRPYNGWVFNLGYAIAHDFRDIHIDGDRYLTFADHIVFVENTVGLAKPRYLITETSVMEKYFYFFGPEHLISTFELTDRKTGEIIADWASPNSGWPGDKTGKSLSALLHPNQNINISVPVFDSNAIVESIQIEDGAETFESMALYGVCPASFELVSPSYDRPEINTPNWRLRKPLSFKGVFCNKLGVFIMHSWLDEDLGVTWIGYDGEVKLDAFIIGNRTKRGNEYYPNKIRSVEIIDGQLIFKKSFFRRDYESNTSIVEKETTYYLPYQTQL